MAFPDNRQKKIIVETALVILILNILIAVLFKIDLWNFTILMKIILGAILIGIIFSSLPEKFFALAAKKPKISLKGFGLAIVIGIASLIILFLLVCAIAFVIIKLRT